MTPEEIEEFCKKVVEASNIIHKNTLSQDNYIIIPEFEEEQKNEDSPE